MLTKAGELLAPLTSPKQTSELPGEAAVRSLLAQENPRGLLC